MRPGQASRRRDAFLAITIFCVAISGLLALAACGGGAGSGAGGGGGGGGNQQDALLKGAYVFSATGSDGNGLFNVAGVLTADGSGNITSGVEDFRDSVTTQQNLGFNGNYSIGSDGRGTLTLNSSSGSETLRVAMISSSQGLLIEFDGNGTSSGTVVKQDATALSASGISGPEVLTLNGLDSGGFAAAQAAAFTSTGSGTFNSGAEDANDGGIVTSPGGLSGSYSVGSNGRGSATITDTAFGTRTFTLYVVSASDTKVVEVDSGGVMAGDLMAQSGSPFSSASFSGNYGFTTGGQDTMGFALALGGVLTSDGSSTITMGTQDLNDGGTAIQGAALSGNFTAISGNGRGTLTLTSSSAGSLNFAIYLVSPSFISVVGTNSAPMLSGTLEGQQGSLSAATLNGNYAINFDGVTAAGEEDIVGQLIANGAGTWNGTEDVNQGAATLTTALGFSGSYNVGSNGRGAATLQSSFGTSNQNIYVLGANSALFLGADSSQVLLGFMQKQQF